MYFSFASVTLRDWMLQCDVPLRAPLMSSSFGRLILPPGDGRPVVIAAEAQPTMAAFEAVLCRPSYAVFASRVTGAGEAFYAAIAGGSDEAVVVVNEVPDSVSVARVERGRVVDSLAAVLPRLTPARVSPLKVSDYRVAQVNRKLNEGASGQRVTELLAADDPGGFVTEWWIASRNASAGGFISGMRYSPDAYDLSADGIPFAGWVELSGQALMQVPRRDGGVVFEPYSEDALARAFTVVLSGALASSRGR
jgi:hypothetical protein